MRNVARMPVRGIHPHVNKCGSVYVAPIVMRKEVPIITHWVGHWIATLGA